MFVQLSPTTQRDRRAAAVRRRRIPIRRDRVRRQPLRVRLHDDAHDLARHARELDLLAESHAAAVTCSRSSRAATTRSFREFAAPRAVKKLDVRRGHRARSRERGPPTGASTRWIRTARGPAAAFSFGDPDFSDAFAARQRGAAVGVSARLDDVLRVDAAALGIRCGGRLRFRQRGVRDLPRQADQPVSGEGQLLDWTVSERSQTHLIQVRRNRLCRIRFDA